MRVLNHPDECSCFCCLYEAEAAGCIEAGLLDPWDLALGMAQILVRIVNDNASPEERSRRAELLAALFCEVAALPQQEEPAPEPCGTAVKLPRRLN